MTDYMNEAERLLDQYDNACLSIIGMSEEQARAALLAHIQRGVPEGDDGKRVLREVFALCEDTEAKCYEDQSDFNRGRSFEAKGIARAIGAWYQEEFCGRTHMGEPAAAAPAPAEVPMPEPVAYGIGNTAITGHTNRLMMVRIDIPGGDQYAGAFWLPLVLADEAHTYGVDCRAAGEAAGYARAANWLRASAEKHAAENGYHEPDTGSFVFASRAAEEWNNSVLELADEMEAALRGEVKP